MNNPFHWAITRLLLSLVFFLPLSCHLTNQEEPEREFSLPTLHDSLGGADFILIVLLDTAGDPIDTLFHGVIDNSTRFLNLPAKNYTGGQTIIRINALQNGKTVYHAERLFDGKTNRNLGTKTYAAPFASVQIVWLANQPVAGDSIALPPTRISPVSLVDTMVNWASKKPSLMAIQGSHLKFLAPGKTTLVAWLHADTTKRDSLEIEIFPGTPIARPVLINPIAPVNTSTPTWTWSSGDAKGSGTFRYSLDNPTLTDAVETQATSYKPPVPLSVGVPHTLHVQEKDKLGGWSPIADFTLRIDTSAPAAPMISVSPASPTNNRRPTWTWTGGPGDEYQYYRYKFGNGDFGNGGKDIKDSSFTPLENLDEGVHVLSVQMRDSAGNWSAAQSLSIEIDLTAPAPPEFDSLPLSPLNTLKPIWKWKGNPTTANVFRARIDDPNLSDSPEITDSSIIPSKNLEEGMHTLYLQQKDKAGNWSGTATKSLVLTTRSLVGPRNIDTADSEFNPTIFFDKEDGLYLSNPARPLLRFNGTTWDQLGTGPQTFAQQTTVVSSDGKLIAAGIDSLGRLAVKFWNGAAWKDLGDDTFLGSKKAGRVALFSTPGKIFLAYTDSASGYSATVQYFDGNFWRYLGFDFGPAGNISEIKIVSDGENSHFAALVSFDDVGPILVPYHLQGSNWNPINDPLLNQARPTSSSFSFITDPAGIPHVSFIDRADSKIGATVIRYKDGKWAEVGDRCAFPVDYSPDPSLAFDSQGRPFIAFADHDKGGDISVGYFDGNQWKYVGSPGISGSGVFDLNLAISPLGVPHVMFRPPTSGSGITIVKTAFDP